jgi:hypothetical protein
LDQLLPVLGDPNLEEDGVLGGLLLGDREVDLMR